MSVGNLSEFEIGTGNWSEYVEILEMYFLVNKVDEHLKLPTLISCMGQESYELLSRLISPVKPAELTFKKAVEVLTDYLEPKESILKERYKFRRRRQNKRENISDFVKDIKRMVKNCEYKTTYDLTVDENLRDQFIYGLRSDTIREKLFAEEELGFGRAVMLALSLEKAEHQAEIEKLAKLRDNRTKTLDDVVKKFIRRFKYQETSSS